MTRLVINSSPLILLIKGGYQTVLFEMADEIIIPDAVFEEINAHAEDGIAGIVKDNKKISIVPTEILDKVTAWDLGKGETAVISFAYSNRSYRPVLDDAEAKSCCFSFGLKPLGTGSLLIKAKQRRLIPSVRIALQDMKKQGMWISDAVIELLAQKAGE